MEKKNVEDLSLAELKALAYDLILSREKSTQQLQAINQLIARKQNAPKEEKKPTKPEKAIKSEESK